MSARVRPFSDSSCLRASNSENATVSVFRPGLAMSRKRAPCLTCWRMRAGLVDNRPYRCSNSPLGLSLG